MKEKEAGGLRAMIRKVDMVLDKLESTTAMICFVFMMCLVLFGVLSRFVLHIPMMWLEEASRYLMVTGAYIGVSMATRERAHLVLTFMVDVLPEKIRRVVIIAREIISIAAYVLFTGFSISFLIQVCSFHQKSAALRWPMWIMYIPLVVGFGLSALHAAMVFVNDYIAKEKFLEDRDDEVLSN